MGKIYYGKLDEFEMDIWAYRAEIQYQGKTYKLWKEHGIVRRLEIFISDELMPEYTDRFILPTDLFNALPLEIQDGRWEFFSLSDFRDRFYEFHPNTRGIRYRFS